MEPRRAAHLDDRPAADRRGRRRGRAARRGARRTRVRARPHEPPPARTAHRGARRVPRGRRSTTTSWSGTTASYEGVTTATIRETVPGWTVWTHPAPGGETAAEVGARVDRVIARARAADGDTLLFGHSHCLRALAARWLGQPVADGRLFRLDTATALGPRLRARDAGAHALERLGGPGRDPDLPRAREQLAAAPKSAVPAKSFRPSTPSGQPRRRTARPRRAAGRCAPSCARARPARRPGRPWRRRPGSRSRPTRPRATPRARPTSSRRARRGRARGRRWIPRPLPSSRVPQTKHSSNSTGPHPPTPCRRGGRGRRRGRRRDLELRLGGARLGDDAPSSSSTRRSPSRRTTSGRSSGGGSLRVTSAAAPTPSAEQAGGVAAVRRVRGPR